MTIPLGGRRRGGAEKGESASNAQAALFAGTGHRTAGASKKDQAAPRSPSSAEDSTADLERVIAVIHGRRAAPACLVGRRANGRTTSGGQRRKV